MTAPVTTALYASLAVFLLVGLGGYTSSQRGKHKSGPGDLSVEPVLRASRAHGNLAEYLGPFIGVLLFAELLGGSSMVLHSVGGVFLVSRIIHAYGILGRNLKALAAGAVGNYLVLAFAAGYGLYLRFMM